MFFFYGTYIEKLILSTLDKYNFDIHRCIVCVRVCARTRVYVSVCGDMWVLVVGKVGEGRERVEGRGVF